MPWLIVLPTFIALFLSLINFITIRKPLADSEISDFVSVIVPLRNEANNVIELIENLRSQNSLANVEFILLDDNSDDSTFDLVSAAIEKKPNFRLIQGEPLPFGWIGKVWALHQLLAQTHGEIIVSIDADVRLTHDALSKSITLMKSIQLDFLSPYPRQIAQTLGERLIQPLLQWSWMSTLLLRLSERTAFSSMAVANGQFFVVKKRALDAAGGYEAVKNAVLDDVFLARRLIKTGSHGAVVSGAKIAECRMYSSWSEIEAGYGKSLRHGFGSIFGSVSAIVFIFLTGVAPLILALSGSLWGWLAFASMTITRILSAHRSRMRIFDSLLHPISSTLLIYLILYSYVKRGDVQWKGRTV
ncbi:MAG: glycosyltransferase [Actinobacteria bacterium]|jgi:glycosyltransferase involved in cell wall biosynthesis|nr:glycosyltransferase [Actinomycetota bacterium]